VLVLQGNAATKLRRGGKYYLYLIRKWFLVTMQKQLLKSANIWQSYSKNKSGPVFVTHSVYYINTRTHLEGQGPCPRMS